MSNVKDLELISRVKMSNVKDLELRSRVKMSNVKVSNGKMPKVKED